MNKANDGARDMARDKDVKSYQIRLQGHLHAQWSDWFDGLTMTLEDNGETLLTGPVADQAELHGLLRKVRDLGIPLLSVNCMDPGRADVSDSNS